MSISVDECMYVVVEFTEEHSVAAIPSIWLDGNNCVHWPPYKDASLCKHTAKSREVAESTCESIPIKVWLRTDDWHEANAKVLRLEEHSQTESADQEKLGPSKRRIRSPDRYQWSDEGDTSSCSAELVCQSLPKLKTAKSDEGDTSSCSAELVCQSLPKLKTAKRKKDRAKRSRQLFGVQSPPSLPPPPLPIMSMNAPGHLAATNQCTESSEVGIAKINDLFSIPSLEPIFNRIFQTLEEIKADQKKIAKKQKSMEKIEAFSVNVGDMFPLKSQEDINEMEIKLLEPSFQDAVLKYLRAFRGRCVAETVRQMLQETMGHEIAKCYNLSGKGNSGKKSFQLLRLCTVIFDGVQRSHPDAVHTAFRVAITNWFDGVKDRKGGRKDRGKKTQQGPDIVDAEH